jgi:hypothetical protein
MIPFVGFPLICVLPNKAPGTPHRKTWSAMLGNVFGLNKESRGLMIEKERVLDADDFDNLAILCLHIPSRCPNQSSFLVKRSDCKKTERETQLEPAHNHLAQPFLVGTIAKPQQKVLELPSSGSVALHPKPHLSKTNRP